MNQSIEVIKINQLYLQRGKRCIFRGIDLTVQKGKITAIMGPSGSGKTTLLKLIGGQLAPSQGEVFVNQQNLANLNINQLYILRKQMGMLFQASGLFTHLNVFENVAFPLREHTDLSESMIRTVVLIKLNMVGLRGAQALMPNELSGGMARRVALARAIALDPQLILYDEPFAGQDPISMGVLVKLIRTLNQALGLTTVMVSHDVPETLSIADYVYVITADGRLMGKGSVDRIQKDNSPALKQFLHGLPDGPIAFHYPASGILDDLMAEKLC